MERLVVHWMHDGILEIKHDYKELQNIQSRPPSNLWDVFRINILFEDVLPLLRRKIRKHQQEMHALTCTCKDAYINGYPKNERNLRKLRETGS